jgi:hypothetical protein
MYTCIYSNTINRTCTIMRQKLRQIKRSKRDPTISPSCSSLVIMFIKDITYTTISALYFDLNIDIDSDRRIRTKIYDEKNDFN